jgi:ABC-type bacteriocin/lantibiotic exporter with double-glycine peptidase domain
LPKRSILLAVVTLVAAAITFAQSSGIWIDVPFVKQSPEGCGAASLAMVMQYWEAHGSPSHGDASDAANIFQVLHTPKSHGIYASAMERYLREHGFRTFALRAEWNDLEELLQKGRPLIVGLKPAGSSKALHYVVVAGIDPAAGLVMFNDPAGRKLTKLDRKSFEREWAATHNWTLLALPREIEP